MSIPDTTMSAMIPARSRYAHEAADLTSRELASWRPGGGSADADLLPELDTLRRRGRDMSRNHSLASGLVQTLVDTVVGTGLRYVAKPDYRALGFDLDWSREWSRTVEGLWRSWSESKNCDATRTQNFTGLTAQVLRARMWNGEALALPLWINESTVLQTVESDRLCNPHGEPDSEYLKAGIGFDRYGAPAKYHIRRAHPGDPYAFASQERWVTVPARTKWGRSRVIHAFDKERPGQSRGKPIFAAVMTDFRMLGRYQRSELEAAIVNAMIAAFIKTPMQFDEVKELFGGEVDDILAARDEHRVNLKGGSVLPLFPGDELQAFTPTRPISAFGPFMETGLRTAAAGLNVPYEFLVKDFSKTNYSSARAALLEAWRYVLGLRYWLVVHWCLETLELKLEEWIDKGWVEAPGFYEMKAAYLRSSWIGPGRGWVDPGKEAGASATRLTTGITTLAKEMADQGEDWEETLEQQRIERDRLNELGLPVPGSQPIAMPVANEDKKEKEED